jgi:hypothetical protein
VYAAQPVGEYAGRRGADPAGMTVSGGYSAVQRLGKFKGHKGDAGRHELEKSFVQIAAGLLQDADRCLYAGTAQGFYAPTGDKGIGVGNADYHPRRFYFDEFFHAGRRLAEMAARLKRYIEGCAGNRLLRVADGLYFRMGAAEASVKAFAYNAAVPDDHGADHWVWAYPQFTALCKSQRPVHVKFIVQLTTSPDFRFFIP